ncbi:CHAT domain-containing protein [Frankia sp. AvcI1]|uniref:CHAT domain-containing protein n=1 Tax=Frankia sp. AvcI1 TaxID=573496 RepID=UPI002117E3D4|nr:CHAT domain-containing protein [Frankia sp. AvcI1]
MALGPEEFFASDPDQLRSMMAAMEGLRRTLPTLTAHLPPHDPTRRRFAVLTASATLSDAMVQGRWSEAEDELLAELERLAPEGLRTDSGEDDTVTLRFLIAMTRAYRCQVLTARPGQQPTVAEIERAVEELEAAFAEISAGPLPATAASLVAVVPVGHWLVAMLLLELVRRGPVGAGSREPQDRAAAEHLLDRARQHWSTGSVAGLPLSQDNKDMIDLLSRRLSSATVDSIPVDPVRAAQRGSTPVPDPSSAAPPGSDPPAAPSPSGEQASPADPAASAEASRLAALEEGVRRLREMYAEAGEADRGRAALSLGLAIADFVDHLPAGDTRLPELAREGVGRLTEAEADEHSAELASARARALSRLGHRLRVAPPTATVQPSADRLPGAPFDFGPGVDVNWPAWREAEQWTRSGFDVLRFLSAIAPGEYEPVVQAAERLAKVSDASGLGSEATRQAGTAYLNEVLAHADTVGLDDGQSVLTRAFLLMFRIVRATEVDGGGQPVDWPSAAELDTAIADLEGVDHQSLMAVPAPMAGMTNVLLAGLIVSRVQIDIRDGVDGRPVSWYDDTIRRLEQVRGHLASPPPMFGGMAQTLRDACDRATADLRLARDVVARLRSAPPRPPAPSPAPAPSPPPAPAPPPASAASAPSAPSPPLGPAPSSISLEDSPSLVESPSPAGSPSPADPIRPGRGGDAVAAALLDEVGGSHPRAEELARRASASRRPEDITAAIEMLRVVRRGLAAGDPTHALVLAELARMLGLRARVTDSPQVLSEAIDAGVEAVRAVRGSASASAVGHLVALLVTAVGSRQTIGPVDRAQAALLEAQQALDPADSRGAVILAVAIGAARSLQTWQRGPAAARTAAAAPLPSPCVDAERMLPDGDLAVAWYGPARQVYVWALAESVGHRDRAAVDVALRVSARLEKLLAADPAAVGQVDRDSDAFAGLASLLGAGTSDELAGLGLAREMLTMLRQGGPFAAMLDQAVEQRSAGRTPSPMPAATPAAAPLSGNDSELFARRGLALARRVLGPRQPGGRLAGTSGAGDRPQPDLLRAAATDLHAALGTGLADAELRIESNATLGCCLAELYWQAEADSSAAVSRCDATASAVEVADAVAADAVAAAVDDAAVDAADADDRVLVRTLVDAVEHIGRALAVSAHAEPTLRRADLLETLARCYRELYEREVRPEGWLDAQRTASAALRELSRLVMVVADPAQSAAAASRANDIVARAVGWSLADDRPDAAVRIAEAGRALVLSSTALAGDLEHLLRTAGRDDLADAWRSGGTEGRLAALDGLWELEHRIGPLSTPSANEIQVALARTSLDAVIYLIPPAAADTPAEDAAGAGAGAEPGAGGGVGAGAGGVRARAIVLRPLFGEATVLELAGVDVGPDTPLDRYLRAFRAAVDLAQASGRREFFLTSPGGPAWADALEDLGRWAYDTIVGPLVEHTRTWRLGREPRVGLVPVGTLAAVPFAAAWKPDPDVAGGRRYAVHDLVLSYEASARLLAQTARRPRQELGRRVVFVTDPTGEFPFARRLARQLRQRQYPGAEMYGLKRDPSGLADTAAVLGALPGDEQPGASLLHLSIHGSASAAGAEGRPPEPALLTADGWLPLTRILAQARSRPPDAPGGLIITDACLTDTTSLHFDESLTVATALLAAGATGVVATRWPVDHAPAAILTYRLHFHLHRGHPVAQALRLAQLDLIAPADAVRQGLEPHLAALPDSLLAHPARWACYVHHGV